MIYIISYPRSGNTLFRAFVEFITNRPTDGLIGPVNKADRLQAPLFVENDNFVAKKLHSWNVTPDDTVFFLLRDFRECIIRHNKAPRGIDFNKFKGHVKGYMELIRKYDEHRGFKALFYYEDFKDWGTESVRNTAKKIYPDPQSGGEQAFHSLRNDVKGWGDYVKNNYPDLTQKYLLRYV